jgi:copper oxidase (laccase) domain-containing protein|tara:strand:- start:975 stop:1376 length:402 start_codon:yes stop_codon:yes gene_type:complete
MKVKMKNGEFVELFNGLTAVKNLKGVKFGLLVSKNIRIIQEELKDIEEASKPTEKFLELSQKMQVLMNQKDDEAIAKLEEENKELVEERKVQLSEIDKLLLEETEIELHAIPEDCLPTDITGEQIINIDKIIE